VRPKGPETIPQIYEAHAHVVLAMGALTRVRNPQNPEHHALNSASYILNPTSCTLNPAL